MLNVIPGILEKTPEEIDKKLQIIKNFSRTVHIDFIDGNFGGNETFMNFDFFNKYKDDFFLEAHLMVEDPTKYLQQLSYSGFKRYLGHIERMKDLNEFIALGQVLGEVGIAIDFETQMKDVNLPFENLDSVLLMSVKAGYSGQEFLPDIINKICEVSSQTNIPIEVDGGINDRTILLANKAGASRFVATSYITSASDPMQAFGKLAASG